MDENGRSSYITEGALRASHRKLGRAPYHNWDLPFHSHYQSDLAPLPKGEPVELVFALLPISQRFPKGSRIRIAVAFADADNFETPVVDPPPRVHLLRSGNHSSFVELPTVPSR